LHNPRVRELKIEKLSDEFGQYLLLIQCPCDHSRRCHPKTLAAIAGWDAKLSDVVKRMRCSKCGEKRCTARAVELTAPRGYKSH
jgi:ribosomal protein RSM22 (predicted rRNA methylase)